MGILSGLLQGVAGGVIGGAEATGKAAEDEVKFQNQKYFNEQMADMRVQEAQRIADYQMGLKHAEEARNAGILADAGSDPDAQVDALMKAGKIPEAESVSKMSENAMTIGGQYGIQGTYKKSGNPNFQPLQNVGEVHAQIIAERAAAAAAAKSDPAKVAEEWAKTSQITQAMIERQLGQHYLVEPTEMNPKGVPDAHYGDVMNTLASHYLAAAQYANPTEPPSPYDVSSYVQQNAPVIMDHAETRAMNDLKIKQPDYNNAQFMHLRRQYSLAATQHFLQGPQAPAPGSSAAAPPAAGGTPSTGILANAGVPSSEIPSGSAALPPPGPAVSIYSPTGTNPTLQDLAPGAMDWWNKNVLGEGK